MEKALRRFNEALRRADPAWATASLEQIRTLQALKDEANELITSFLPETPQPLRAESHKLPPEQELTAIPVYCVSSMFLHECYQYLIRSKPGAGGEPEWMLAVTGLRIGHFLTLEHRLEFKLSNQSLAQASADMKEFTKLMIDLSEFGQALHAIFHSHRLAGPPSPSGIDMHLQETLEQASYPAIQAVFSEDGYIRFFARNRPFEVLVYGKGVDKHGRFLYRLNQIGKVHHS